MMNIKDTEGDDRDLFAGITPAFAWIEWKNSFRNLSQENQHPE